MALWGASFGRVARVSRVAGFNPAAFTLGASRAPNAQQMKMSDQSFCDVLALEHFAEEIIKHPNAEAMKALGSLVNLGGPDSVVSLSVAVRLCLVQMLSSCCQEPEVEMDYEMLVEGLESLETVVGFSDDDPTVRKKEIDDIVRERIPSLLERVSSRIRSTTPL